MPYLTAAELLERFGPKELAELATADDRQVVDSGLMRATIAGSDRSAWDAEEIEAADEALARVQAALDEAGALIDGYLRTRYPLPLDVVPLPLKRVAADAARYYLMDDQATEEVRDRYAALVKLLQHIRDGQFTLGAEDPSPAQTGSPAVSATRPSRVMTTDMLGGYTG